jgi:hypothetical protein
MKRFRRWLFNGVAALSLPLCVASAFLWVRSLYHCDCVCYRLRTEINYSVPPIPKHLFLISTGPHVIDVSLGPSCGRWGTYSHVPYSGFTLSSDSREPTLGLPAETEVLPGTGATIGSLFFNTWANHWQPAIHAFAGFGWESSNDRVVANHLAAKASSMRVSIPMWFLVAMFAILPFNGIRKMLRALSRSQHGLCTYCGYDLRATPDRCPECGTVSPKS